MKRIGELLLAVAVAATGAVPQEEESRLCEHEGRGPTRPAEIRSALETIAGLDLELARLRGRIRRPGRVELPRCPKPAIRRQRWGEMPDALKGRTLRFETTEGLSEGFLERMGIRCLPTEVRFRRDGIVEWRER